MFVTDGFQESSGAITGIAQDWEGDEGHNMGEGYSLTSIARSKQKQAIGLSLRFSHLYV